MLHGNSPFTTRGVERLGIEGFTLSDGPYGVRREIDNTHTPKLLDIDSATYLPKGPCLSSTWNIQLGYDFGRVLGSEASYRGKDIILGPGINIIKNAPAGYSGSAGQALWLEVGRAPAGNPSAMLQVLPQPRSGVNLYAL